MDGACSGAKSNPQRVQSLKVLLVNAYARSGGASVAARRLCAALNAAGTQAILLVQDREDVDDAALLSAADCWAGLRPFLDTLPVLPHRHRRSPHWGNAWLVNGATRSAIREYAPDITHLHWVNHGILSVRDIAQLDKPVVWTMHDSWAFTGGCHSPQECLRFREECGCCPELGSRRERDLSRLNWKRKKAAWQNADITVITPSRWQADAVKSSSLLAGWRIETIPNAVDTRLFRPMDQTMAREAFGLPRGTPLFLFTAHGALTDWNKGGDLWKAALPAVADACRGAEAVLAGTGDGAGKQPMPVHELGVLTPERMGLAIAASDVVVVPSRMENLPNVVAESLACGTPVAAFAVGGIPEMVIPGRTGFLARPHDTRDLAKGICELLASGRKMRDACSAFALASYAPEIVARQHLALYRSLQSGQ